MNAEMSLEMQEFKCGSMKQANRLDVIVYRTQ